MLAEVDLLQELEVFDAETCNQANSVGFNRKRMEDMHQEMIYNRDHLVSDFEPNGMASELIDGCTNANAGSLFVMESKGTWVHAGYHLTTSIASPSLLSLPFAFAGLGWGIGITALVASAAITFYSYNLMSKVLEKTESNGHRHVRLGDLCTEILGRKWTILVIGPLQFLLCMGSVVSSVLLCGQSMKIIYVMHHPNGPIMLCEFIILFGVIIMILSQLPSFHSLRYINLLSLLACLGYSLCVVYGAIHVGYTSHPKNKDYSILGTKITKTFNAFNSLAIFANTYGSGIIPEIQE